MRTAIATLFALFAAAGYAQQEQVFETKGKVDTLSVAQHGQDFRVTLETAPNLCGTAWTVAYLNANARNYDTYVQTLLHAKAEGWTVTLVTKLDKEGQCQLTYMVVR